MLGFQKIPDGGVRLHKLYFLGSESQKKHGIPASRMSAIFGKVMFQKTYDEQQKANLEAKKTAVKITFRRLRSFFFENSNNPQVVKIFPDRASLPLVGIQPKFNSILDESQQDFSLGLEFPHTGEMHRAITVSLDLAGSVDFFRRGEPAIAISYAAWHGQTEKFIFRDSANFEELKNEIAGRIQEFGLFWTHEDPSRVDKTISIHADDKDMHLLCPQGAGVNGPIGRFAYSVSNDGQILHGKVRSDETGHDYPAIQYIELPSELNSVGRDIVEHFNESSQPFCIYSFRKYYLVKLGHPEGEPADGYSLQTHGNLLIYASPFEAPAPVGDKMLLQGLPITFSFDENTKA